MKMRFLAFIFPVLILIIQGCSMTKQVGDAYNMTKCKYEYNSISHLALAGIDVSQGVNLTKGVQLASALASNRSYIPLNFTVNLNVINPTQTTAALHGVEYILKIDNIEFTKGLVNESLNIPSGKTRVLPLAIGFDLATLLSRQSGNAVENIVRNFIGVGNEKSRVSLQVKPFFKVGEQTISAPYYIPVNFTFGGK